MRGAKTLAKTPALLSATGVVVVPVRGVGVGVGVGLMAGATWIEAFLAANTRLGHRSTQTSGGLVT